MSELAVAILKVMKSVGYVQKEGKVSFKSTNYRYAGEADLIKALRPHMIEAGLTLIPTNVRDIHINGHNVRAVYEFTLLHNSGESMTVAALGDGMDSGDKASYKAATGALKYALRQTFIIETGDDPDKTSSEELHSNLLDQQAREDSWKQYCTDKIEEMKACQTNEKLEACMTEAEWQKVNKKLRKDVPEYYDRFMERYNEIYNNLNASVERAE